MLQLLLEGGQGYDDIASLLGIGPDEVRTRARLALQEIGGSDPDARVGLTDYLLGQADPIGRADAVRQLQADPETNALAQRLVQNLRLLAPKAELPEIPEPRGGHRTPPPPPAAPPPIQPSAQPSYSSTSPKGPGFASRVAAFFSGLGKVDGKRRTQLIVGSAGVLAIVIVLIVVLAGGGGGDNGQDCKPLDASQAQQGSVARVDLKAIGPTATEDCAPVGQVNVVPIPAQQQQGQRNQSQTGGFALATDATHLQPTENGDVYLLWLYKSDDEAAPLGQQTVNDSGNLSGATGVPVQGLLYLQQFPSIRVSRVTQAQAQQLTQAIRSRGRKATSAPFVGTPVLEGSATALLQQMIQRAQAQRGASGKSQ